MHKRALLMLALLAWTALTTATAQDPPAGADDPSSGGDSGGGSDVDRKRKNGPWFCHKRDCPKFRTVEEHAEYALRCYERSSWAISCAFHVTMPDAVLLANARVMAYVQENDLWGGTPFANVVRLSLGDLAAWSNATQLSATANHTAGQAAAEGVADDSALGCVHKTVCAAYFLPSKYQGTDARAEVDRRPPRPSKDSHVRIFRAPRFEAFVSGFPGFPTPPRFVWESMRLVNALKWGGEDFDWRTALFYVYDPPSATTHRWNEVLIPAKHGFHDLLFGSEAEELFTEESVSQATVSIE